jgi:Ca-activated chloride channel homolog
MRCLAPTLVAAFLAGPLPACQTALVLAIDVSNSVDEAEYRLQVDGLAQALLDPDVTEALLRDEVALMVFQWSGTNRQIITQPWARMTDLGAIGAFALSVAGTPRQIEMSDTAPAEALSFAVAQFAAVADCQRWVIDISGDGTPNAGGDTRAARAAAGAAGVTVNGIAIESLGLAITGFYRRDLITADGFVMTARTHREYPAAIRAKLIRELASPVG